VGPKSHLCAEMGTGKAGFSGQQPLSRQSLGCAGRTKACAATSVPLVDDRCPVGKAAAKGTKPDRGQVARGDAHEGEGDAR